ncbi:MAG: multidrug effflux MFS transporter [bacterium]|nr:multidrug effflux MFS transporter [bacterium]
MKQLSKIFFILVLTATLGQFFSDLYLPSLPAIAKSLKTSTELTQLTVSLFLLGFSISSFFYGPISDTIGRKKPLILGILLCLIGSIICVFASNIYILILGRIIQGFGGGAGASLTTAIIRDCFEGKRMAKLCSYLTMANMIVVIAAPMIGGYIQDYFVWRFSFQFLLAYSFIVLFLVMMFIPETKHPDHKQHFKFNVYRNNIFEVLKNKTFIGYLIVLLFTYGGIFAWLTIGSVLTQKYLFLSPSGFAWLCLLCGTSYAFGAFLNSKFVAKYGIGRMFNFGQWLMFTGGILMLLFAVFNIFNIDVIIIPLMIYMIGAAMIFPNSYTGALVPFVKIAGFATAILIGSQIFGGFLVSFCVGFLPNNNQFYLAVVLMLCAICVIFVNKTIIVER